MAVNLQKPEGFFLHPGGSLDFINTWHTIQGEGPFAGRPAVFVRLAGCNLKCPFCDTNYTVGRRQLTVDEIVAKIFRVKRNRPSTNLVVITGGEPFRQNIFPLVDVLGDAGFEVQIETNGTLPIPNRIVNRAVLVCAPKTESVHESAESLIGHWKYVLEHGWVDLLDGLPTRCLGYKRHVFRPPNRIVRPQVKVYVQPLDEQDEKKNKLHTEAAVQSCLMFGYTLCLQMHKIVGLD